MSAITEEKLVELLQGSPVLAAFQEYKRFCTDPVMRERERDRQRFLRDQRLDKAYAYDEGKAEGRTEGRTEGKAEIARNMKAMKLSTAVIAQATGLSAAEIEQLQ